MVRYWDIKITKDKLPKISQIAIVRKLVIQKHFFRLASILHWYLKQNFAQDPTIVSNV